jgi:hypothetical protein
MGRKKTARRFDPFYPATVAAMEAEAEHVRREADDYAVMAPADVEKFRVERHANLKTTWRHLNLIMEAMPERDQRIVQSLLFRDLWYVLELYKTYLQPICREIAPTATPPIKAKRAPLAFSEFLFDLPAGKER